ncbi:hypothetical protein [Longibacter salinarum]|nr:hypothetical protein [Longibacter salinarum]
MPTKQSGIEKTGRFCLLGDEQPVIDERPVKEERRMTVGDSSDLDI